MRIAGGRRVNKGAACAVLASYRRNRETPVPFYNEGAHVICCWASSCMFGTLDMSGCRTRRTYSSTSLLAAFPTAAVRYRHRIIGRECMDDYLD